jgi:hypothetical protein
MARNENKILVTMRISLRAATMLSLLQTARCPERCPQECGHGRLKAQCHLVFDNPNIIGCLCFELRSLGTPI